MADILPITFPEPPEKVIASYDYTDIAEGTGIVIFYAAIAETSGGNVEILTAQSAFRSSESNVVTPRTTSGTTTLNFDLAPFNLPKYIKGTAYIQCATGGVENLIDHVTVQIKKWDGTTATNVSAEITSQSTTHSASIPASMRLIPVAITSPGTHFKKGEILRLTVKFVSENNGNCEMGNDPAARDGSYIAAGITPAVTTQFAFHCPFRLDL